MSIWCKQVTLLVPEASKSQTHDAYNGFHHLYVIMRPQPANYGIDMDQQLYGLLRKYGAKVTLLVPEASKS